MNGLNRSPAALRAKLLLGVVGTMAATTTTALGGQTGDQDKWVPYTDIGGGYGSGMTAGKADAFVPIWQNVDSLLFGNLGIGTETKTNQFENFGLGYRTKVNRDWILGGYAGFDSTQLQDNNTFNQTSLGAELMSAEWDVRLNGYIAANEAKTRQGQSSLYIAGTTIAVMDAQDVGYTGFDGEVGYRVFSTDNTDVRVFVGGFMFGHVNSNQTSLGQSFDIPYREIAGPKARAELTVYDLDILGPQSRLTLDGEVAHDDVRGTTGYVGATLRIPLGNFGGGAQALDELDRRMADPERRNDTVLTLASYTKPEPVIIYGPHVTSQPTNTLLYVDNTQGVGTYANPTTFADAASRNTTNAFIVITSKQGPVSTAGVTLQPGQTVVPGGQTFTVEGEFSHAKFVHDFDAATDVKLVGTDPTANVITLASNSTVYDVDITGTFANAIYGKNVHNVNIDNVVIQGSGVGTGIDIVKTSPGAEKLTIANTTVSNTNVGIQLNTDMTGHGATPGGITLSNVAVHNTASDGIVIDTYAGNGATVTSTVSLTNVTVTGAGGDGIDIYTHANGHGSSIAQTLGITNASVSASGHDGIAFDSYAQNGGAISSVGVMSGLTIAGAGAAGIEVDRTAAGAQSSIAQVFTLAGAGISATSGNGITLDATAKSAGTVQAVDTLFGVTVAAAGADGISATTAAAGTGSAVNQVFSLADATISGPETDGVFVSSDAQSGARIASALTFADVTVSGAGGDGLHVYSGSTAAGSSLLQNLVIADASTTAGAFGIVTNSTASYGGKITDKQTLSGITISGATENGINIAAVVDGGGADINETVAVSNATVSNVGGTGMRFFEYAYGGTLDSKTTLSNAKISNTGVDGVLFLTTSAYAGAVVDQTISVTNATITNAGSDGIVVQTDAAYGGGTVTSSANLSNITVSGAASDGIFFRTTAFDDGATVNQTIQVANATITKPGYDGLDITAGALYGTAKITSSANLSNITASGAQSDVRVYAFTYGTGASVYQALQLSQATLSNARLDAVSLVDIAGGGGQTALVGHLSNIAASNSGGNGIDVYAESYGQASVLNETLILSNATVTGTYFDGISVRDVATGGGQIGSNVSLSTVTLSNDGRNGVYVSVNASGANSTTDQTVSLADATISGPGKDGIAIKTEALGGATVEETATLSDLTISGPSRDGIYVYTEGYGAGSAVLQTLSVSNATISHAGSNGVFVLDYAGSGGAATGNITLSDISVSYAGHEGFDLRAIADGSGSVVNRTLTLTNATLTDPGRVGIYVDTYAGSGATVTSNATIAYVTVTGGTLLGIFADTSAYSDGAANATLSLSNATVSQTGEYGIGLSNFATGGGAVTANSTLSNITVSAGGYAGITYFAGAQYGGSINGSLAISDANVSGNANYGIEILGEAIAGSLVSHDSLSNITVGGSTTAGISIEDFADFGGTAKQYVSVAGATISGVGGGANSYGLHIQAVSTYGGSYAFQSSTASNVAASYVSGGTGVGVSALAQEGGAVVQTATLDSVSATHSNVGLSIFAEALDNGNGQVTTVDQTVTVSNGTFSNNAMYGIKIVNEIDAALSGYHSTAASSQTVSLSNVTADYNGTGVSITDLSSRGSSISQNVSFYGVQIEHNTDSGVRIDAQTDHVGFAGQYVTFNDAAGSYNEIAFNGTNGISMAAFVYSGGEADQHLYVYSSHFHNNGGYGIGVGSTVRGFYFPNQIYYSHLQQNIIVAYGSASNNAASGISVNNNVQYGAQLDQFVELYRESVDHNARGGLVVGSNSTTYGSTYALPTGVHSKLYIENSDLSYNGGVGASVYSKLTGPVTPHYLIGYAETLQYVTVSGSTFTHNGTNGFSATANDTGLRTVDEQIIALQNSQFSHNTGDGVDLIAKQTYGTGAYGDAIQSITINGSDFSHNGGRGLYASAAAYQEQGRAEQYITATGSTFDYNAKAGIRLSRIAENGVYVSGYPCGSVQNPGGGCAFVRQTFSMSGGSASYNGAAGINISNYANNFGAIYAAGGRPKYRPTVEVYAATVNGNGTIGLVSETIAKNHSYVYSYVAAVNSSFDHNKTFGFIAQSAGYAGASIVDRNLFYTYKAKTSASYDGRYGIVIGEYAGSGAGITETNLLYGVTASHNTLGGISLNASTTDGLSHVTQSNEVIGSQLYGNGQDGVSLYASGAGARQSSELVANSFQSNGRFAIYGAARTGAYQLISYKNYGNMLNGGGTEFVNFGGTQIVE